MEVSPPEDTIDLDTDQQEAFGGPVPAYTEPDRSLTLFNVIQFSFCATRAIAGILFFIALFQVFAADWFRVMWWPFFAVAILPALGIVFLCMYWFTWDRRTRQSLHLSFHREVRMQVAVCAG
jgi:hypothetical protein